MGLPEAPSGTYGFNVPDISTGVSFPEPPKTTMLPWGTDRNLQGLRELESSTETLWGEMGQAAERAAIPSSRDKSYGQGFLSEG